ncbi:MAG: winged helix-turn-helix domain-containing protein, partial [Actinomycetota bacterium]
DGLPLAIELAAARSRVLTPVELVTHLDAQLDVLARPGDDGRHGSLRRAIETSYVPLDEGRRTQLQRLSTIPGSFDLRLAHRIAPAGPGELDTLDALSALVDSSLVDSRATADGHTHYRLLDTIRAYALEQLEASGKLEEVQEDFVSSMVDVADEILAEGMKHFSSALLERIRDRFPHLVAAIDWCLERDETADRAYRLILPFYGPTGARSEAAHLARRVAARWEGDAPLKPEALAVMATVTFVAADYDSGRAFAQAAIAHPDASDLARVIGYRTLGMIAATDQELETAKGLFERGLEAASGIEAFARELRISWAGVAIDESDREEVSSVLAELVAHARGTDEAITLVWAMVTHAVQLAGADDFDGAEAAAAEAQDAAARSGVPWATSTAARVAGSVAAARGETERSIGLFRRSLEITAAGGDMEGMAMTLRAASGAAVESGDLALAEALWATIPLTQGIPVLRSITHAHEMALQERLGRPRGVDLIELSARARSLLGGEVAAEATAAGEGVIHRFERCELDVARHELRCDGAPVHVEPQVYDVLRYLVERAGQLVTKHDLMDNVWGDRFVSEAALSSRIAHARKAVGDDGKQQRVIKTVHGRGFTFVADVK